MSFGKWLLVAAASVGAVHIWHLHQRAALDRELQASADGSGFVPVLTSAGAPKGVALILAAVNCPSAQAQRADSMAKQLSQMAVLSGEIPVVIIDGMAKANPTVDEVVPAPT